MNKMIILVTTLLGFSTPLAFAAPITWEIRDLILGPDSAPVTGQFSYDAATGELFDIDIRSGAGRTTTCSAGDCSDRIDAGLTDGYVYDSTPFGYVPDFRAFSFFIESDRAPGGYPLVGSPILLLTIGDAPTTRGVFALEGLLALEFLLHSPTEPFRPIDPHRWSTLGSSASIASVPEPGSIVALGLGVFLLIGRRITAAAQIPKLR